MGDLYCLVCHAPCDKFCARCKSATYCDREHQTQDWPAHKDYCRKVEKAGANTFDAILFPVNEIKPRMVKVPYTVAEGDEYEHQYWHKLDVKFWFKQPDTWIKELYFDTSAQGDERMLCLCYDDHFMSNKSPLNRCIMDITKGQASDPWWSGNVVGLRIRDPRDLDFKASANMEEDLEGFVKHFLSYESWEDQLLQPLAKR